MVVDVKGCSGVLLKTVSGLVFVSAVYSFNFVSALTYQSRVGVDFTFNSSLSLAVSGDLIIDNLIPGNFLDSNTIQVTVNTNNAYGYKLTATVGNTNNNSSELRHISYSTTGDPIFSSIALNSNLARNTFSAGTTYNDKWGYSIDGASYNGLPVEGSSDDPVMLLSSDYMPTNGTASSDFLIGAKASSNKPSGDYTNVVNFYAVANAGPMSLEEAYRAAGKTKLNGYYKMQDMSDTTANICGNTEIVHSELQVIDTRDNKVYWIAKLQDGHCWMTQNLDLDLETSPNQVATLTSENTDLLQYGLNGYTSSKGYSCSNASPTCEGGVITWIPANATIKTVYDGDMYGTFNSFGMATNDNIVPKSLDVGNWYFAGHDGVNQRQPNDVIDYLDSDYRTTVNGVTTVTDENGVPYFSTVPFTGSGTSNNGTRGHVGNYYNWTAAVASNDTSSFDDTYGPNGNGSTLYDPDSNPQNSVCPAGWRLPTLSYRGISFDDEQNGSRNEFARLAYLYTGYIGSSLVDTTNLEVLPVALVRAGAIFDDHVDYPGYYGYYWSSTVLNASEARRLSYSAQSVYPMDSFDRYTGRSVRCVAR